MNKFNLVIKSSIEARRLQNKSYDNKDVSNEKITIIALNQILKKNKLNNY